MSRAIALLLCLLSLVFRWGERMTKIVLGFVDYHWHWEGGKGFDSTAKSNGA